MKHINNFDNFDENNKEVIEEKSEESVNEGLGFLFGLSAVLVLLWMNYKFSRFGYSHTRRSSTSWQSYPFKGFMKYFRMSKIIKRYKNEIHDIDETIFNNHPNINKMLKRLTQKSSEVNVVNMTPPTFDAEALTKEILSSCTKEQREEFKELSDKFNREMEELFYED